MLIKRSKKGVSVIIGYVLLIVFAMVISVGVYAWLKTYVPSEPLNCPDGVSLFLKDASFNSSNRMLNVTARNNGRFDVAGYFIHAANSSSQNLPSIDLSSNLIEDSNGITFGNSVLYSVTGSNFLKPGDEKTNSFSIPSSIGSIYSLRVTPTRFQEEDNRQRFVSCGDSRVDQIIGAPGGGVCSPSCSGKVCGNNGCGGSCGTCGSSFFCDASGQCISSSCSPASNPCGTKQCGTATNGTCGTVNCGPNNGLCNAGFTCNATSQCVSLCGNGAIDAGEGCDDGNATNGDGCSSTCTVEFGYTCSGMPSACNFNVNSCPSYCVSLGYNANNSGCTSSVGTCGSAGGLHLTNTTQDQQWCTGGPNADTCCCKV